MVFISLVLAIIYLIISPLLYLLALLANYASGTELERYVEETYDYYGIPTVAMVLDACYNSPRLINRLLACVMDNTMYYAAHFAKLDNRYLEFLDSHCL